MVVAEEPIIYRRPTLVTTWHSADNANPGCLDFRMFLTDHVFSEDRSAVRAEIIAFSNFIIAVRADKISVVVNLHLSPRTWQRELASAFYFFSGTIPAISPITFTSS